MVEELLDVKSCPARPQYIMAKETPLCFFDCSYHEPLKWLFDQSVLVKVFCSLQKEWTNLRVKCAQVEQMMGVVGGWLPEVPRRGMNEFVTDSPTQKHIPLMKRPRCESLDARIEKAAKKAKQQL